MQVIFDREVADQLRSRYTVLELETFEVEGKQLETFCVIPAEKIALSEVASLEQNTKLHEDFVKAAKEKNYELCGQLYMHLIGKFGGELDSFYDEVVSRI